jgi:hypothetical protein
MQIDSSHAGVAVGVGTGLYKGLTLLFTTVITTISWDAVFDTAALALIGGAVGWLGAEIMKALKGMYLKHKRKKDDKSSG